MLAHLYIDWILIIKSKVTIKSKESLCFCITRDILLTAVPIYAHSRAFNFGCFRNGEYGWPLPEVFQQNKDQIETFSRVSMNCNHAGKHVLIWCVYYSCIQSCHASAMNIMEAMAIALEVRNCQLTNI